MPSVGTGEGTASAPEAARVLKLQGRMPGTFAALPSCRHLVVVGSGGLVAALALGPDATKAW